MNGKPISVLVGFAIVLASLMSTSTAARLDDNDVIAIVQGKRIYYKDIRIKPDYYIAHPEMLSRWEGRKPTETEIRAILLGMEKRHLTSIIRGIIEKDEIKKLGLQVSSKETDRLINKSLSGASLPGEIKEAKERFSALAKALKALDKNPEASENIYREQLASVMTPEQWMTYQRTLNTTQKRQRLIKEIEKEEKKMNIEDIKKDAREGVKPMLLRQKLKEEITKDVTVTEGEIEQYYQKCYKKKEKPKYDEALKATLRGELLEKKKRERLNHWWGQKVREENIQILADKFKDVIRAIEIFVPEK